KMKRFIFGFQRRVWCPKCTPLSRSWRMVTTAMARPSWCGQVHTFVPATRRGRIRLMFWAAPAGAAHAWCARSAAPAPGAGPRRVIPGQDPGRAHAMSGGHPRAHHLQCTCYRLVLVRPLAGQPESGLATRRAACLSTAPSPPGNRLGTSMLCSSDETDLSSPPGDRAAGSVVACRVQVLLALTLAGLAGPTI